MCNPLRLLLNNCALHSHSTQFWHASPLRRTLPLPIVIPQCTLPVPRPPSSTSSIFVLCPNKDSFSILTHYPITISLARANKDIIGDFGTEIVLSWVNLICRCYHPIMTRWCSRRPSRRGYKKESCGDKTQICYHAGVKESWTRTEGWKLILT